MGEEIDRDLLIRNFPSHRVHLIISLPTIRFYLLNEYYYVAPCWKVMTIYKTKDVFREMIV